MKHYREKFWVFTSSLFLFGTTFSPAFASGNDNGKLIVYCGAGLAAGVFFFINGFIELRTKRLMEDIPTSTIRAMAPGLVEISGKAVPWGLLKGPFTQEDCVYYQYLVEQYVSSGKSSHWETILKGDTQDAHFYVQDETGMVLVGPKGADVVIPDDYVLKTGVFTDIPPHVDSFLGQHGISCRSLFGFEKTFRFTERHLLPGETVFVVGTCQESTCNIEAPPAGAPQGVCVSKGERSGDVFILSDESQKQLESSFGTKAFFGIFGGIALIGFCLWGILHLLGVS